MTSPDRASNRPSGRMNGGRALAEMLRLAEVGPMFGMGGFQLLPFYDALAQLGMRHFLINDERCGAFAADAYARVTNRPGVCDGTLGPGATNLVTGLIESLNAGTPIIALAGDTNRAHSWKNMTQECRQAEILRPAVKELIRVELTSRVPELLRRAFAVATSGRPGPVLLDVPEDVCHGEHDFSTEDFAIDPSILSVPARRIRPDRADIARAAALIARAERPLILAGGGIHLSRAYEALLSLAEGQSIPVAHTMSGKGGIACTHPLSVGLFGRYSRIANDFIEASDCLVVVGCKLGEIATKRYALPSQSIPLIHLDILAEEIGRCRSAAVALWGDAKAGLEDLAEALTEEKKWASAARADYISEIPGRMSKWREEAAASLNSDERPIHMARLCRELNHALPADSILVADGGFAGHWTGLLYDTKSAGRHFIPDRGLASIGYGRCRPHDRGRQQCGLGLRQGIAARDVPRPLSILRPRRNGLCGNRERDGLQRSSRRGSGAAWRGVAGRPRRADPPDRARRRRHPRPRPHVACGRQPHGRDQAGRPGSVSLHPAPERPPWRVPHELNPWAEGPRSGAPPRAAEGMGGVYFPADCRTARVAALATAFNEAVTISLSMPTP